jgi:hypothetical protein
MFLPRETIRQSSSTVVAEPVAFLDRKERRPDDEPMSSVLFYVERMEFVMASMT